jgi:hypothetical protein
MEEWRNSVKPKQPKRAVLAENQTHFKTSVKPNSCGHNVFVGSWMYISETACSTSTIQTHCSIGSVTIETCGFQFMVRVCIQIPFRPTENSPLHTISKRAVLKRERFFMDVYQTAEDSGRAEKKGVCLCETDTAQGDLLLSLRVMAVKYMANAALLPSPTLHLTT